MNIWLILAIKLSKGGVCGITAEIAWFIACDLTVRHIQFNIVIYPHTVSARTETSIKGAVSQLRASANKKAQLSVSLQPESRSQVIPSSDRVGTAQSLHEDPSRIRQGNSSWRADVVSAAAYRLLQTCSLQCIQIELKVSGKALVLEVFQLLKKHTSSMMVNINSGTFYGVCA